VYLELTNVRSIDPDFKPPTRRNGEELMPSSVTVQGQYLVVRFFGWEPVEGPAVDQFFLEIFYGPDGREVFRASGKIFPPPPPPPTLFQRLIGAMVMICEPRINVRDWEDAA
jgi:hypothetical protein